MRRGSPLDEPNRPAADPLIRFSQWMLLISLVVVALYGCGQLAIFTGRIIPQAAMASVRNADYAPWKYLPFEPIRSDIVAEVLRDRGTGEAGLTDQKQGSLGGTAAPKQSLTPGARQGTTQATSSATAPEATSTPAATLTSTPNPTSPSATATPSPTPTPLIAVTASATASATPLATITSSPTPTPVPNSGASSTFWLSSALADPNIYTLVPNQPNGNAREMPFQVTFTTGPLDRGGTLYNDQAVVYLTVVNGRSTPMPTGIILFVNGEPVGSGTLLIPTSATEPTVLSTSFTVSQYGLFPRSRIRMKINVPWGTVLYFDGQWNASRIILPLQFD